LTRIRDVVKRLHDAGIVVSLFLDPESAQIDAALSSGADAVELHTGAYALAALPDEIAAELAKLESAATQVCQAGLDLHAGHGLNYRNVRPIAGLPQMQELNIGHSIVARAVMVGMQSAVREMKDLIR
jgi:pyridoxine 5-phosphate synthase